MNDRPWDFMHARAGELERVGDLLYSTIEGYEDQAAAILEAGGHPYTLSDLRNARPDDLPQQLQDIRDMIGLFDTVRIYVRGNFKAELSAFVMAGAIHAAIRAQLRPVEPFIEMGKGNVAGGKRGGKKSAEARKQKATLAHDAWQEEADKIGRRRPKLSKRGIAKEIGKKTGDKPETIRRSIKKPTP